MPIEQAHCCIRILPLCKATARVNNVSQADY
jgi:hypothetical protein